MTVEDHFPLTEDDVATTPPRVARKPAAKKATGVHALSLILERQNDIFNKIAELQTQLDRLEAATIQVEGSVTGSVYGKAALALTLSKSTPA